MASTNKTTNGLNIWSNTDKPERLDFNADNEILDRAISLIGQINGLQILGTYDTAEALESAVTSPGAGDLYNVGTEDPYHTYMWDGVNNVWVDLGEIKGQKGADGEPGPAGEMGPPGPAGPKGDPTTINAISPDEDGNITLTAADIPYTDAQSVGGAFTALPLVAIFGSTVDEIQAIYDNHSADLADGTHYKLVVSHGVPFPPLGGDGGTWYVEGYKAAPAYEWQVARRYYGSGIREYVRSKSNGTWVAWSKTAIADGTLQTGLNAEKLGGAALTDLPSKLFISTGGTATGSCNDLDAPGLNKNINPGASDAPMSGYFYIFNFAYGTNRTQLAIGYNNTKIFMRYRFNGTWSAWAEK